MRVLPVAMREADSDVRLERALVRGEAGVAINSEQRTTCRARVRCEERADLGEMGREADEQERGPDNHLLVPDLVLGEPLAVVVPSKLPQEIE